MPRVIHFEVMAQDPQRALRFYTDVFGWKAQKWEGPQDYWLIQTGEEGQPGINGGLVQSQDPSGSASTVNTIDVPSVDEYTAKVTANGGTVVMPRMAVPGVGYLVYCKDTEGIIFGMMQMDPSAA